MFSINDSAIVQKIYFTPLTLIKDQPTMALSMGKTHPFL